MLEIESIVPHPSLEEECRRNPELKVSDLELLRDWLKKQPHLPKIETFMLIQLLHTKYYRIEPTKQLIDNLFTSVTHAPELFLDRDPITSKELQKIFTCVECIALEQQTKEGYTMIFSKFKDTNPQQYNFNACSKYLFMVFELQLIMNGTSNGMILIFDTKGFSFSHLALIDFMIIKKIIYFMQMAFPARLQGIHLLNSVPAMQTLVGMAKPFIKSEWINKIHVHTDMETVKKFLPIKAFPCENGGKAGPSKELAAKGQQLLQQYREWFQYTENLKVDESLRVGSCKTTEFLFGVDGSFKKLDID